MCGAPMLLSVDTVLVDGEKKHIYMLYCDNDGSVLSSSNLIRLQQHYESHINGSVHKDGNV